MNKIVKHPRKRNIYAPIPSPTPEQVKRVAELYRATAANGSRGANTSRSRTVRKG